eukprot:scaffold504553_cov14-Prasinocladus_malaysianus.AAC.1
MELVKLAGKAQIMYLAIACTGPFLSPRAARRPGDEEWLVGPGADDEATTSRPFVVDRRPFPPHRSLHLQASGD